MLLGARQFFERRGGGGWQNPYITDGLIAMWDGEWNAGGGVHDPNATTWVDLSGHGLDFSIVQGNSSWLGDAILGTSRSYGRIGNLSVSTLGGVGFVEFVGNPCYGIGDGVEFSAGIILEGTADSGTIALRIRGYGSRKTCQLLAGSHNAAWYDNGWGTKSEDRIVYCAGEITDNTVGDVYYDGQKIDPFRITENWVASTLVCLGAYRVNDERYGYSGSINAIRLYNRALTAAEVAANYEVDKERFNLP